MIVLFLDQVPQLHLQVSESTILYVSVSHWSGHLVIMEAHHRVSILHTQTHRMRKSTAVLFLILCVCVYYIENTLCTLYVLLAQHCDIVAVLLFDFNYFSCCVNSLQPVQA